jgi:hypothetical protein
MKYLFSLLYCLILINQLQAQKHDYFWLSGDNEINNNPLWRNFILDFNYYPLQLNFYPFGYSTYGSQMSMADENGKLVFFSNGCYLKNANNQIIEGGETISEGEVHDEYCGNGGYTTNQGIFSIPRKDKIYDIFHYKQDLEYDSTNGCMDRYLLHTVVDMAENNGNGKVLLKDEVLLDGCFQRACANRHANGRDWWIVMSSNNQDTFYRFLATPEGIKGPWIQGLENPTIDAYWYCGWSEFSPDGNKFMINQCRTGVAVYDFDRCTGLLSNPKYVEHNDHFFNFGACFSPDSRFIYFANDNSYSVFQADLLDTNLNTSQIAISKWDSVVIFPNKPAAYGFLQRGPDGIIYIWAGGTHFLHRIGFPNRKGLASSTVLRYYQTPYEQGNENLYYPNYRLGSIDGSPCDSLGLDNHPLSNWRWDMEDSTQLRQVTFTDNASYEPTTWHWDFGDGTISQDTSPVHTYAQNGVYYVCMTVCNANSCDTLCRDVYVGVSGTITENVEKNTLSVLPNPAHESVTVSWTTAFDKGQLEVFDIMGRKISTTLLSNGISYKALETANYASGMYLVRLTCGTDCVYSQKFIVEH